MPKTTVMIVERRPVLSQGLAVALGETPDLAVVGSAASLAAARAPALELRPDVLLVDGETAEEIDALVSDALDLARVVVVLVSDHDAITMTSQARATVVPRELSIKDLIAAIRRASSGEASQSLASADDRPAISVPPHRIGALSELTQREIEILGLLMRGMSHRAIAEELHIAVNTVRTHTHNIQLKLNVHSNLAAVAFALGQGISPR
jgi:DNA-binding NarL/FixJ family response regulator